MAFDYFDDGVRDIGYTGEVEISGNETIDKWREFILGSGEMAKTERSEDFDQAYTLFLKLIKWLREEGYIRFSKELSRKAEYYVVITKFPMEIRTRVKSTNASENLHKELEKIKQNGGGYFQSMRILEAKWGMYLRKLREGRWRRPEPRFKGALPELYRLFRSIYESEEVF